MGETEKIDLKILGRSLLFAGRWASIVFMLGILPDLIIYIGECTIYADNDFIAGSKIFLYSLVLLSSIAVDVYFFNHSLQRDLVIAMLVLIFISMNFVVWDALNLLYDKADRYLALSFWMLGASFFVTILIKTNIKYVELMLKLKMNGG